MHNDKKQAARRAPAVPMTLSQAAESMRITKAIPARIIAASGSLAPQSPEDDAWVTSGNANSEMNIAGMLEATPEQSPEAESNSPESEGIKTAAPVECACGDAYPARSYGAGFIDACGRCPNCEPCESFEVLLPEPAVPYAVFDCHGFYETKATNAAAQSFCNHYNRRDADGGGSAPYTVQALYTEQQVRQILSTLQK